MAITFPTPTQLKNGAAGTDPTDFVTKAQVDAMTGGYTVVTSSSTSYTETATSGDKVIILTSSTSATVNVTLPSAVGNTARLTFKRSSTAGFIYSLVIAATASQTIDGSATFTAPLQYTAITLISDNANWFVI
jgi:hypothetical protein